MFVSSRVDPLILEKSGLPKYVMVPAYVGEHYAVDGNVTMA